MLLLKKATVLSLLLSLIPQKYVPMVSTRLCVVSIKAVEDCAVFKERGFFCQYTALPHCLWHLAGESSRRRTLPKGCLGLRDQSCSELRACIKCLSYNVFRSHNCQMALQHCYEKIKGITRA